MNRFIREFGNVIPLDTCRMLINKFEHYARTPETPIRVEDKFLTDGGIDQDQRTKEATVIYLKPEVLEANDRELLELVGLSVQSMYGCVLAYFKEFGKLNIAPLKVDQVDFLKYEKGKGFYGPHVDAAHKAVGHRVLSLILYLYDVEEGGETEFPLCHRRVKPETGKLLMFPSFFGFLHQSNKVISNSKYILATFTTFSM